jgi:hypothetical protein
MVAVDMRYENMVETRELQALLHHLQLCAFAAVNHEELVAEIDDLTRGHVSGRRGGRAATEYVDAEICHDTKLFKIQHLAPKIEKNINCMIFHTLSRTIPPGRLSYVYTAEKLGISFFIGLDFKVFSNMRQS